MKTTNPNEAQERLSVTAPANTTEAQEMQPSPQRKRTARLKPMMPGRTGKAAKTCETETLLIAGYLTSQLSPRTLIAFESHLKLCPDCRAFLQTYRKTVELTRAFLELKPAIIRRPKLALRAGSPRRI